MHRDHLHGASRRCRSGAAESTGVDQSLTSIIAPSVLSGSQVGGFFNLQSRTCRHLLAGIPLPYPRRTCEAFAFSQILSNPIAGLAPRFGPSSKQLQYSMGQPGEAFGRFSVTAQATPKVLAHIVLSGSAGPARPSECTNSWTQLTGNPCYPCIYRCSFRPNATVCDVLRPRTGPSHWPAHLSRRGTDDDVSHDCACLNSSESEW